MRLSTSSVLSALAIIPMAMGAALPDNAEVAPGELNPHRPPAEVANIEEWLTDDLRRGNEVDNPLVERTIEKRVFEGKCDPQQWGWCQLVTSHHWTDSNNVFVRAFGHDCHEIGGTWTSNGLGGKSFSTGQNGVGALLQVWFDGALQMLRRQFRLLDDLVVTTDEPTLMEAQKAVRRGREGLEDQLHPAV